MSYLNVQQKDSWESGDFENFWKPTEYELNLLYRPDTRHLPVNPDYRKNGLETNEIMTEFFYSGIKQLNISRHPFILMCEERLQWNISRRTELWNLIIDNRYDWITPLIVELRQISHDSILNDEPFVLGKKLKIPGIPFDYTIGNTGKRMYQLIFLYSLADTFLRPVFVKDSESNEVRFSIMSADTDGSLGISIHDVGDEDFYFWIDFKPVVTKNSMLSLVYSIEMLHCDNNGKKLSFSGKNSGDSVYIEVCKQMKQEAGRVLLDLKHKIDNAKLPVFSPDFPKKK